MMGGGGVVVMVLGIVGDARCLLRGLEGVGVLGPGFTHFYQRGRITRTGHFQIPL